MLNTMENVFSLEMFKNQSYKKSQKKLLSFLLLHDDNYF